MILNIKHALFYYEHLFDNPNNLEQIKNFAIRERSGFGLELYLKETAAFDEEHLLNSTYLVKDKKSHDIVGYFCCVH